MVAVMANGLAGNAQITEPGADYETFKAALYEVMMHLTKMLAKDGEGATKFVEVKVVNAPTREDAKLCAEAVANSLLCKTAWFGNDPNWGRVVAALGYSGATFDPNRTDIFYDDMPVVRQGGDAGTREEELADIIRKREFTVLIDLHAGEEEYWVWTCDVSYDYVKINADYHT